jgi:acetyl-CoA acetyltransferase
MALRQSAYEEPKNRYGIDSMPETAENVAAEFGIEREAQDRMALRSQANTFNSGI